MEKRKHFNNKKYPSERAYFTTALRCYKCGAKFHPKISKKENSDTYYITYYCNNKQLSRCDCCGISHIKVLNEFEKYISNIILEPQKEATKPKNNTKKEEHLLKELNKLESKRKSLQSLFINDSLKEINNPKEDINFNDIQNIITNFKKNWDYLDTKERNNFITQFVKEIDLDVINGKAIIKEIIFI